MDGTPEPGPASGSITPTSAQEQARLRRERRNAKIMAGGSARINKITSMSGRPAEAFETQPSAEAPSAASPPASSVPTAPRAPPATNHDDPEEVDISQHFYTPSTTNRTPSRSQTPQFNQANPPDLSQMQQMLAALNPQSQEPNSTTESEDPMLRMLSQMLGGGGLFGGGAGFGGGDGGGDRAGPGGQAEPDIPPGLAQLFSAFTGTGPGAQQQNVPNTDYIWRIIHAIFAILLAGYITLYTSFTGSRVSRYTSSSSSPSSDVDILGPRLFYAFATAQLLLQSSRYFLEKGRLPASAGLLGGLGQLLPEPWGGYVRVWSRYSVILSTVVADGMVVVFVMGMLAWWRGGAVA